jgi:hypothetical protein
MFNRSFQLRNLKKIRPSWRSMVAVGLAAEGFYVPDKPFRHSDGGTETRKKSAASHPTNQTKGSARQQAVSPRRRAVRIMRVMPVMQMDLPFDVPENETADEMFERLFPLKP